MLFIVFMSEVDLNRLEAAIRNSWSKETSSTPEEWSLKNPARGQCAVTALVVQDHIRGAIVYAKARTPDKAEESHYFNRFGETEYDLTRLQFPVGTQISRGGPRLEGTSTRDYVLSFSATQQRYELLKDRVAELLKD